ncbi:lipopolysaccharide biosynthesis protein [Iodobacter ciconiae]|uniref:Lipopolysaccharide biosynthesis protein n=1 Tax=Iodobacter ciconiae TaxID=2496266 RepID=A0A3S8ZTM1_9NEIS|nr:lipopolysaccharide biosynthesis protein [Iodobacter ciconiae]AZN36853.1 lipopolysaccharide biosynthesis protein [Iodobacter ciconiae]
MSDLNKVKSGMSWGTASTVAVAGFQIIFMAVLARLIDPAAFGLVALANIGLRFLSYFAQLGIGPSIIQRKEIDDKDIVAALYVSLTVATFFSLMAILLAPLFSSFFSMPKLTLVLQVLALNFIVTGFSVVAQSLLRRGTRFKVISIIDAISYIISYGAVGLSLAYMGMGVWSLVAAVTTQIWMSAVLSYLCSPHAVFKAVDIERCKNFLLFGSKYSFIGFIEFFSLNTDSLLVGKLLGDSIAGQYNRGQLIAHLPVQNVVNIYSKIMFPIMSRAKNSGVDIVHYFLLSILAVGIYAFPVGLFISIYSSDIVYILLGQNWQYAGMVTTWFSCMVGFIYLNQICGMTMDSLNEINIKMKIQISMFIFLLLSFSILYPLFGLPGLIISLFVTEAIRFVALSFILQKRLNISTSINIRLISYVSAVTLFCGAFSFFLKTLVLSGQSPLIRVLIAGFSFVVIYICLMFLFVFLIKNMACIGLLKNKVKFLKRFI